jgi:hypothetical protein
MVPVIMTILTFCMIVIFYLAVSSEDPSQAVHLRRLHLTYMKFIIIVLFSAFIGLFVDRPIIDSPFFFLRHFSFSTPLFLILLMSTIYVSKLRIRFAIIMMGAFYGFSCWVLTLATHLRESGEWYGLGLLLGVIPSSLVGAGFGLYLSFQVKEETSETNKRKLIGFVYKSE